MSNEHLDRAIDVADKALEDYVSDPNNEINMVEYGRIHARALLTSVWEQVAMARKPYTTERNADFNDGVAVGFETALHVFRRIGIEGDEG